MFATKAHPTARATATPAIVVLRMTSPIQRPNTVAGLQAKRKELIGLRDQFEANIKKLTVDIDHLEAAIRLFDPEQTPAAIAAYAVKHRAKHGHMRRFILEVLRQTPAPMTSKGITEAWVGDRGLRTDEATYVILRKRVGACLIALRNQGLVETVGEAGGFKTWRLSTPTTGNLAPQD